ncbi:MAG: EfeM/EfeO family lipoprotein, partial [Chloroflexus sp.]
MRTNYGLPFIGWIVWIVLFSGCSTVTTPTPTTAPTTGNLSGIKDYLLGQTRALVTATAQLQTASNRYYDLVQATNFDYAGLWQNQQRDVITAINTAREAWITASPIYERMEGIVAGTPALAQFDVDLDAGAAG